MISRDVRAIGILIAVILALTTLGGCSRGSSSSSSSANTPNEQLSSSIESTEPNQTEGTTNLNSLQQVFCEINQITSKDEIDAMIIPNKFVVKRIGQDENTYYIGYTSDAINSRGRDREGEAIDVVFNSTGSIRYADYAIHTGFSTSGSVHYEYGKFTYRDSTYENAEDAMQAYLSDSEQKQ